ncbi:Helicase associated domain protein [Peribacillus sp. RS7]
MQIQKNIMDVLIELTKKNEVHQIKDMLENLDVKIKGNVFELYIEELFKGNGWLTARVGGKSDFGADILLYHPKNPTEVSLVVQTKNHRKPLSFDDSRIELIKFEEKAQIAYQCNNYNLISINGFVKDALELEEFNMKMEDWDYVVKLIENYSVGSNRSPEIELYAHNKITYNKIIETWNLSKKVAAVQSTGTGKSFLITKTLSHFFGVNKLVLAPSQYILQSIQRNALWLNKQTIYMTYAKLMNINEEELKKMQLGYLVMDEFHRVGAEKWGKGVERLLQVYPEITTLGTSATPIRYLDKNRDMTDELFEGKVASNISLPEAIVRGYLPKPYYVSSLYTLHEEIEKRKVQINSSSFIKNDEKEELLLQLKTIEVNWESSVGVPQILKKHLTKTNKFIVFCRNKEHLSEMEWLVEKWFKDSGVSQRIKKNRVISDDTYKDAELSEFIKSNRPNTTHLLFAIDMLNEGLHIKDITGVILLRPTISPTVFYQQIGRAIASGDTKEPIIFDLVNNFNSILSDDFSKDLNKAQNTENNKREKLNLPKKHMHFSIFSESKEAVQLFSDIDNRITNAWDYHFQELLAYKLKHGNCLVPGGSKTYPQLSKWVSHQRRNYLEKRLSEIQISKLEELGFAWKPDEASWNEKYDMLVKFKEKHGHCMVPHTFKEVSGLYSWVVNQRTHYSQGTLSPERMERLKVIDFAWNKYDYEWDMFYKELVEYKNEFGDCLVPSNYPKNERLAQWMTRQRTLQKKGDLSADKIAALDKLGFPWDALEEKWNSKYQKLYAYQLEYGNCIVPPTYDKELNDWVKKQRKAFHSGMLDEDKKEKLDQLNFSWSPLEETWNANYISLSEYKKVHGDCNVPARYKENPQLSTWVSDQRKSYKRETLPQEKIEKLEALGFVWGVSNNGWNEKFKQLKEFHEINGHTMIPGNNPKYKSLSAWAKNQRKKHSENKLSEHQLEQLNQLDFVWSVFEERWNDNCESLKKYQQIMIETPIVMGYEENKELSRWVSIQRGFYHKDELENDRKEKLENIGFFWSKEDEDWTYQYCFLKLYKEEKGDCLVPIGFENKDLAYWVSVQRKHFKSGKLEPDKISKLNELGFSWHPKMDSWDEKYQMLMEYKNQNGDCLVNKHHPELGAWAIKQRTLYKNGRMKDEKVNKLNELGFVWDVVEHVWNERYQELVEYKKEHGDCKVIKRYPVLGPWVQSQRKAYNEGRMDKEKIKKLENIGFTWNEKR